MGKPVLYVDGASAKNGLSLTDRLNSICAASLQFATPDPTLKTSEFELVQGVLQMLQGFSSPLFYWDSHSLSFCVKDGIYVAHLSQTSLGRILSQFLYSATCLQLVEHFAKKVGFSSRSPPTLEAFGNSVFLWLKRFRDVALNEEKKLASADQKIILTLLGLVNSLSSLFSGAEYLLQVVHGAVPTVYFESESLVSPSEMAVHILDYLYKKLDEVSPVQGGEEEAYHMILFLFVGSLLPCIEGLDSWLYDGTLDDPFEEMFFYANDTIAIDQPAFWEKSYLLRPQKHRKLGPGTSSLTCGVESKTDDYRDTCDVGTTLTSSSLRGKDQDHIDAVVCPLFIKDIAKAIVSAGKSLQLIRHATDNHSTILKGNELNLGRLSLPEIFFISLLGLIYDGCHVYKYLELDPSAPEIQACKHQFQKVILEKESGPSVSALVDTEKIWCKFLSDTLSQGNNRHVNTEGEKANLVKSSDCSVETREAAKYCNSKWVTDYNAYDGAAVTSRSFSPENPVISECRELICGNRTRNFCLPSLNDQSLREAIFGGNYTMKTDVLGLKGTNYTFGFQFDEFEFLRQQDERETFGSLFPFSTLLPCFQEDITISEFLPFQKNSTLASRVLNWMLGSKPKGTSLPGVIVQECLITCINKQVDYVGKHILLNLMNDWRLMDELGVLRAIYLLGSGDLLQHFLIVLFDKLDKGDPWDDEFELNDVLQESIRNSSDVMLLSASDSLVVCITKSQVSDDGRNTTNLVIGPHKSRNNCFDIDTLDLLKFTYKVSWPLELIANMDAIKKYNQVMGFLLKVKRAKYVLDKARRWMWKDGSAQPVSRKRHLLVEQKLLHFVDAFHQYVMDRVFHSAWLELCEGMESAGSLDEVIEVHEAYLLSIQRLCFVAPDKLCSLIATRIKNILGLALDFYSIQQTLCSGAATPAIKANCENQVDWIEKQFNEYIIFLLRVLSSKPNVGHFPHLADLVTRINYNYFYMSDNGSLSTGTASDTTAKIGKTFLTRTDM